ncbi:hypothetical protein [Flavobacterium sp.]|uniref:hypothetical protein n=1 Tax=Flavobacterium sp. TaxID=239 RepID=UPI00286D4FE3|nr:hypothetical protein [Flavobacterium sp.]
MKPEKAIDFETAKTLNSNYNATRAKLHKDVLGKDDSNAVWYSLKELEEYMDYIKSEGRLKGYSVDGIRFYMGVYPETAADGRAGFTTIFLAPTKEVTDIDTHESSSVDILDIAAYNFGSMGNPPKFQYGE